MRMASCLLRSRSLSENPVSYKCLLPSHVPVTLTLEPPPEGSIFHLNSARPKSVPRNTFGPRIFHPEVKMSAYKRF